MICSVKELRQKTSEILDLIDKGEEVIITFRGKKKAKIISLKELRKSDLRHSESAAFGMWKDHPDLTDSSAQYVHELRKGRGLKK